ncbi:citrate/2-methylcitrate synthase [Nocardia sp. BMG51109]|uniref:citrate/2-methylcitrate synthase n=1 Tax=Nocardia sp. BMG51109 TaxID=1056816 RepID=UPI0018DC0A21|nr:citrate/2-methylcitrate synthase [Nocardia sp. BMG51109]
MADDRIDAKTAADRLGVKPATLYSYVSRGVLRRHFDPDRRRSLFDPADIERLARRGKPRRRAAPTEIAIESRITVLGPDRPYYRGRDALELADTHRFEAVAEWLWGGELTDSGPWRCRLRAVATARAVQYGLPTDLAPLDRVQIIVTALSVSDPLRFHLDPGAVTATARTLIAGMAEALPPLSEPAGPTIAEMLWSRLCPHPPESDRVLKALDTALILLADHELASSTFAARVAASVRADPYAVVGTGLGTVGGPMHGGATRAVERLLADIPDRAAVPRVIGDLLRRGERIPGAGHAVYRDADARGAHLFEQIRRLAPDHPKLLAAEAILTELRIRRQPEHNIDFALATLCAVYGLVPGSGEAIFAVARTAGWLAHAMEEYAGGTPLRPRALPARS